MAVSRKMLEVIQKVEAAREEFLEGLRASARYDARVREARKQAETAKRKPPKPVRVAGTAGKPPKAPAKRRAGAG